MHKIEVSVRVAGGRYDETVAETTITNTINEIENGEPDFAGVRNAIAELGQTAMREVGQQVAELHKRQRPEDFESRNDTPQAVPDDKDPPEVASPGAGT